MKNNEFQEYIPDIEFVKNLETAFGTEYRTYTFSVVDEFETYLCAIAYESIRKEIFESPKYKDVLPEEIFKNKKIMQGIFTSVVVNKLDQAKQFMQSYHFQKNNSINFEKEVNSLDFSSIAFTSYYLLTQGYRIEWDKVDHDYLPIEPRKNMVSFKKDRKIKSSDLIKNAQYNMDHGIMFIK